MSAIRTSRIAGLAVALLTAAGLAAAAANPARALDFGPNNGGHGDPSVFCDHVNHRIVFNYTARAQVQVLAGNGLYDDIAPALHNSVNVTNEWIDVAAYAKPAYGGSWELVGRNHVLLNSANTVYVLRFALPRVAGGYWKVGYSARVAYPGTNWSSWVWEPAVPSMSYSGSVAAQYGYCMT
jgi:hypothetical protein